MSQFNKITITPKSGHEPLTHHDQPLNTQLLDFWRWSMSDLVSNANRGIFAEFIVANALAIPPNTIRNEWASYDLLSPEGIKVEVKSAGYLQTWKQRDYSKITYSIAPALYWDEETNAYESMARRSADVYVFCLLKHQDAETLDPLKMEQWAFYVVPTKVLDNRFPNQKTISLKPLQQLVGEIGYGALRMAVLEAV